MSTDRRLLDMKGQFTALQSCIEQLSGRIASMDERAQVSEKARLEEARKHHAEQMRAFQDVIDQLRAVEP